MKRFIPDVISHIKEEEEDAYSDDSLFDIKSWGADLSFRELIQRYDEDELVKPELQRNYVWDRTEASRFIDSVLLGLPVPSIFLAQTPDEKLLIIDGYQRIMTVRDFMRGIFSKDEKIFKLSRTSKINARWRGKAFAELADADQRRIRNTTIHAIIFVQERPGDDDTSLFQVFERINTSGRTLLPQEIRNCVAQGKLNELLFELNETPAWRSVFGMIEPDPRMRDMEYILRFFALSSKEFANDSREKISLKQFLDIYMKRNANPSVNELKKLRVRFSKSIEAVYDLFGASAFHNISMTDKRKLAQKFSPTIFDSITLATDFALRAGKFEFPSDAESARRQLLVNKDYRSAISKETMRKSNIKLRASLACKMLFGLNYE